jgi:hypothetical protein
MDAYKSLNIMEFWWVAFIVIILGVVFAVQGAMIYFSLLPFPTPPNLSPAAAHALRMAGFFMALAGLDLIVATIIARYRR